MFQIYLEALGVIVAVMTVLWVISIPLKNVSIVDIFWGLGFVLAGGIYFVRSDGSEAREVLVLTLVAIWGLRLTIHLAVRNIGHGEDPRYQEFRKNAGPERYWWYSFFQVFLLQSLLMWIVSAPLLGAQYSATPSNLTWIDAVGVAVWAIGLYFEAGSDWQLRRFKKNPDNKGKLLTTGFWKYTRHPNYFGDSAVWWGFGILSFAAGSYWSALGSVFMTGLIIKVSGVALLEKSMASEKPGYREYAERTSSFFPWFPKRDKTTP